MIYIKLKWLLLELINVVWVYNISLELTFKNQSIHQCNHLQMIENKTKSVLTKLIF